ncbi:hypothetical protein [Rufibacter tibetensis]|nr:hypothetical protein [Rufibacter tibetensis]
MNIFPLKNQGFRLIESQAETLNLLMRRTEKSESLTSQVTDKSFRGMISGNKFKIISSAFGRGAFCVLTGEINTNEGHVKVEIHKVFKVLLSIILCFPIIAVASMAVSRAEDFSANFILTAVLQVLMIRYAFIGIAFKFLSNSSLNRLRDVLDLEWIKN